jgi:hypothetical protein
MSKSIQDALDLPTLENLLRTSAPGASDMESEPEINEDGEVDTTPQNELSAQVGNALASNPLIDEDHAAKEARDHETSMDKMYDETIQHSRDLMDLGYNVDTRSAGRIFETAATMYKIALDSKNSKRKAQLDLMKIYQEQQKIDIVEKNKGGGDHNGPIDTGSVIIEDRNEILRQLRDQSNK